MDLTASEALALDERTARAAWSGIAEPADYRVGELLEQLGPTRALAWAASSYADPQIGEHDSWGVVHERVHLRLSHLVLDKELSRIEKLGGRIIIPSDQQWPSRLEHLGAGAPHALWVLGRLPTETQDAVAMVGARASTAYGNVIATDFAFDLAAGGFAVISGGAYGIDAAAHRGAMRGSRKSDDSADRLCPTVAVLCGGLSNLYPAGNHSMFKQILSCGGALVSEMPPSFRPARWRFIERNRIIAALAAATVVVEASSRSGALATANRAVELGKEVGAIPGPITSAASVGTNRLIADGANLVASVGDVVAMTGSGFGVSDSQSGSEHPLFTDRKRAVKQAPATLARADPIERRTWDALFRSGEAEPEVVAGEAGLSVQEVHTALLGLQALGLVARSEAGGWSRVFPA
ncbi:DNA-processing protein DprA [Actinomycetaceae bacterium MB13-C1-2]|nr:DNA-processing protein DprA [Actinomycetaceae bacterium MB13-C1-2]